MTHQQNKVKRYYKMSKEIKIAMCLKLANHYMISVGRNPCVDKEDFKKTTKAYFEILKELNEEIR